MLVSSAYAQGLMTSDSSDFETGVAALNTDIAELNFLSEQIKEAKNLERDVGACV